jgi:hypothetical protein
MNQLKLLIVYDGACPFCNAYVSLLRLRESMQVELLSARSNDERNRARNKVGVPLYPLCIPLCIPLHYIVHTLGDHVQRWRLKPVTQRLSDKRES